VSEANEMRALVAIVCAALCFLSIFPLLARRARMEQRAESLITVGHTGPVTITPALESGTCVVLGHRLFVCDGKDWSEFVGPVR